VGKNKNQKQPKTEFFSKLLDYPSGLEKPDISGKSNRTTFSFPGWRP
jgi:hypothetical protein